MIEVMVNVPHIALKNLGHVENLSLQCMTSHCHCMLLFLEAPDEPWPWLDVTGSGHGQTLNW